MTKSKWAARRMGALWVGISTAWLAACGGGGGSGSSNGSGATTGPVTTSQAGPVNVTLPTYGGYEYWMAYQDGDGPWKLATRSNGAFSFQVDDKAGKYAVMLVEAPDAAHAALVNPTVHAFHFTRAEMATIDLRKRVDWQHPDRVNLSVVMKGAPDAGQCRVSVGTQEAVPAWCNALNGQQFVTPPDLTDAFAVHQTDAGVTDALVMLRDLDPRTAKDLTFDFSKAIPLPGPSQTSQLLDYTPVVGETLTFAAALASRTSQAQLAHGSGTALAYPLLAPGQLRSDDSYWVSVTGQLTQGNVTATRSSGYRTLTGQAQTLRLPPYPNPIVLGIATDTPTVRPILTWTPVAGRQLTSVYVWQRDARGANMAFSFSPAWTGTAKTISYTAPDLSALGWKPAWSLQRKSAVTVFYTEAFTSRPSSNYYAGVPQDKVENETSGYTQMYLDVNLP